MSQFVTPTASLSSVSEVVLDLQEGFSEAIQLTIHNGDSKVIVLSARMFDDYAQDSEETWDGNVVLDLARSLRLGMLEVVGQGGRPITFDWAGELDSRLFLEDDMDLDAEGQHTFSFGRSDNEVLRLFRRYLNPDERYHLGFCKQPRDCSWMFEEEYQRATRSGDDAWEQLADDQKRLSYNPQSIGFRVTKGIPKPEFTMSLRIVDPVCDIRGPDLIVSLCVTSLAKRPVTVKLDLNDHVGVSPKDALFRWRKWGPDCLFRLFNKSQNQPGCFGMHHPNQQLVREPEPFNPCAQLLQFDHGTTHTVEVAIPVNDSSFTQGDRYSLKIKPQGFAAWDYGTKEELSKTHLEPRDWLKHGPIMFEPGSTIAPAISGIFERQRRGPFHRLPAELRDLVYTCLRYDQRGAEVLFTAD